jgi:hypothetical protein
MATEKKTVASFKNYDFDNTNVPDKYECDYPAAAFFNGEFVPVIRREMNALAKKLGAAIKFSKGHFYINAFFSKGGKHANVIISDVRDGGTGRWFDNVLFRETRDTNDHKGVCNCYCTYPQLGECLGRMLG